jgi:class 3 adenylate cyclase
MRRTITHWSRRVREAVDRFSWDAATRIVDFVRYRPAALASAGTTSATLDLAPLTRVFPGFRLNAPSSGAVNRALRSLVDGTGSMIAPEVRPAWLRTGMLVAQPRGVIVLVADMRGFSALTNQLGDTQYLTQIIDEYLSEMTRVIEAHRGIVFQYTGDGLLAILVPELLGVEPSHALGRMTGAVAAEMHASFDDMHTRWRAEWNRQGRSGAAIGLGVGISFGRATVGLVGPTNKKFFGVVGAPVNVAAFLCSQAKPGTTLVDHGSYERAGTEPPKAKLIRLKSAKLHQRVEALCFGANTGKQPTRAAGD